MLKYQFTPWPVVSDSGPNLLNQDTLLSALRASRQEAPNRCYYLNHSQQISPATVLTEAHKFSGNIYGSDDAYDTVYTATTANRYHSGSFDTNGI